MEVGKLYLLSAVVFGIITVIIVYLTYLRLKRRRYRKTTYDNELGRVGLEEVRELMEKQMYALNERLMQSEERWKDVNHLLINQNQGNFPETTGNGKVQLSEFLKANGLSANDLILDNRLVFFLTPFNKIYSEEYRIVRDVCSSMGFICQRGDEEEIKIKGDIFPDILRLIVQSKFIIANINGRNPNVLYELGIAQAMDKRVILIATDAKDIPIDIQSQRFIIYSDSDQLAENLKSKMLKLI